MSVKRRKTRQLRIGNVRIGGSAPVSIQSMAKTPTKNIRAAINEIERLKQAGCEIVRLAVKAKEDLGAFGRIKKAAKIPIVADIHFDYRLALGAIKEGADAVRINPGNIYRKEELKRIIKQAKRNKIPVRIGVNSGSLKERHKGAGTDDLMVKSALCFIKYFEEEYFRDIIISLKSSDVLSTISAYRKMAGLCDYPFHLGVTATGLKEDGIIKSAIGIGTLLSEGIGDTIRVSLTADSISEVRAAKSILQSLVLRRFGPEIISCPTCGRCQVALKDIVEELKNKLYAKRYTLNANRPITIAVMGCEVNGPGEAKEADIGIAAGKGSGVLFKKGRIIKRVKEKNFVKELSKALS